MRVLITGDRNHTNYDLIESALMTVWEASHRPEFFIVVHGDATGADTLAAAAASQHGWPVEPHPADWDRFGRGAGHKRNQEMVDLGADLCLAFPMPGSRGTWDCVRRARLASIPVRVHRSMNG